MPASLGGAPTLKRSVMLRQPSRTRAQGLAHPQKEHPCEQFAEEVTWDETVGKVMMTYVRLPEDEGTEGSLAA